MSRRMGAMGVVGQLIVTVWLMMVGLPAQASGWRTCASEGGICELDGRGVVRYGTDGLWSTRTMSGTVSCNNKVFGDPAPGVSKRCEVRDNGGSGGSDGWAFCASEGETCHLRGSAEVRFGADRQYTVRRAYNSIRCDVDSFGDPAYGQTKHCEVRAGSSWGGSGGSHDDWAGSGNANDSNRWRYCSSEGQTCYVQGRSEVRFGDGRRYKTRTVRGNTLCSTSVFGDPAYGVTKHCEVRASGFGGWGDGGPSDGGWTRCADENDRCEVSGGRIQVRFGTDGRYVYRDVYGGLDCSIESFGRDPYPGRKKQCEARR